MDDELEPQEFEDQEPEQEPEPSADDRDAEAEARKYGWKPREDFTKPPEGWVDAKRFLDFPNTTIKKLQDRIKSRDAEHDERIRRLEQSHAAAIRTQQEQSKRQLAEIRAAQERAVDIGDTDAYRKLRNDEDALRKQVQPQQDPEADKRTRIRRELESKRDQYPWIDDPVMSNAAKDIVAKGLRAGQVDGTADAQLAYADRELRDYFPQKFTPRQSAPTASRVDGGGLGAPARRSKGAKDLPPEAKRAAKDYVEAGIYASQEEYAKEYWQELGQ